MKLLYYAVGMLPIWLLTGCAKEIKSDTQTPSSLHQLSAAQQRDNPVADAARDKFVSNELLVKFKPGLSETGRANAMARISAHIQEHVVTAAMQQAGDREGFFVLQTPLAVLDAVNKMKGQATMVEYAEPNYIYRYDATSNDPYYTNGSMWGINGTYGCQANKAWANGHTGSSSVLVGVIDEGIQYTHPDLSGQIWTNPYEPYDGIDNDGNGYIDDNHGWDFVSNNRTIYDGGTSGTADKHGTHVAGTIGAKGGNSTGVVGINWNIKMIAAKFLSPTGGSLANAVKAIDYITDLKSRHNLNIVATNNSWAGGGYSQTLYDAIERANKKNILFVAAAGNGGSDGIGDNNDLVATYPANYSNANIIAVAAIQSDGRLASFSNYGATTVDLGAPGYGIYSTLAYNTYASYSGTSMATPHVTGAAALYASTHSGASAATIKSAILSKVTPTASLSGKTVTGGRLNVSTF